MSECEIIIGNNGPYRVKGDFALKDADGNAVQLPSKSAQGWVALCRCGHSENKPYCDGKHKAAGFESVIKAT